MFIAEGGVLNVTHDMCPGTIAMPCLCIFLLPIGLRAEAGRGKENPKHGNNSARPRLLVDAMYEQMEALGFIPLFGCQFWCSAGSNSHGCRTRD